MERPIRGCLMEAARLSASAGDPYRRLWTTITIRVAWEMVRAGVRPKGSLLREAREHVLWRVPLDAGHAEADAIATAAAREFVDRLSGIYRPWKPDPDLHLLPDPRWRQEIVSLAGPVHDLVFRLHYADGMSLEEVERSSRLDRGTLRAAREALRGLVREVLSSAGVSTLDWDTPRFDRFMARIAAAASDRCPGPWGLGTESGRTHADTCPRCSRALRLMREGYLSSADLTAPEDACLPNESLDLVAIMLAPEARRHVKLLERTFGENLRKGGEDLFFIYGDGVQDLQDRLVALAENGTPSVAQLKLVRRQLQGRWGRYTILGPAPEFERAELAAMAWGDQEGIEPLPDPLPPPPSAARWWAAAAVVALCAGLLGLWVFRPEAMQPVALHAEKDGQGVVFSTETTASVDIWGLQGANVQPLFHSVSAADKGMLATGDGRYRLSTPADAYIVIASPSPIPQDTPIAGAIVQARSDGGMVSRLQEILSGSSVEVVR